MDIEKDLLERTPLGIKANIKDGDILTLADVDFKVSICVVEKTVVEKIEETVTENELYEYVVYCPKCPAKYVVKSLSDRIAECHDCLKYNKSKIADEKPIQVKKCK